MYYCNYIFNRRIYRISIHIISVYLSLFEIRVVLFIQVTNRNQIKYFFFQNDQITFAFNRLHFMRKSLESVTNCTNARA